MDLEITGAKGFYQILVVNGKTYLGNGVVQA